MKGKQHRLHDTAGELGSGSRPLSESTLRDRVVDALGFRQPDFCPYYIWVDEAMAEPLARAYGVDDIKDSIIHDHVVMTEIRALQQEIDDDHAVDEFGTVYRDGNIPYVEHPALSRPTLKGYTFPDLSTDDHFSALPEWLRHHTDRFRVVVLAELFWERTWGMRGMEGIMMDLYDHPRFVDELLDHLEAISCTVIDRLLTNYGDLIDAVGFTDDMGSQRGMLISPVTWRRFLKPHQARMYDRIRRAGKHVYLHSCGNIEPIVAELVDMGVNILQPIQPEAMDIFLLKAKYGGNLCFAGGVSAQRTLPFGTPEQVREETRRCIEVMGKGGGYIVAPSKPIMPGVPIENAVALIDTIVRQQEW